MTNGAPPIGSAPATVPVALLPVAIETRYLGATAPYQLGVRVFPHMQITTHEPKLTTDEGAAGTDLWEAAADEQLAVWTSMSNTFGATRAAWIARATAPDAARPGTRAGTWTQPALALALPDRWVALGYVAGQEVCRGVGVTIEQPIQCGPTPGAPPPDDSVPVEPALAWMVDFDAALTNGMALTIDAAPEQLDLLIVIGLRAGPDGTAGAAELQTLLDGHLYTDGAELAAQGTPTKNAGDRSGFTSTAPDPATTLALVTGPPLTASGDGLDGSRLAGALGLDPAALARTPGAAGTEGLDAQAVNAALWPATLGAKLATQPIGADTLAMIRRHFIDWIRARGPLPALRLGTQLIGVVPVLGLDRAAPELDDALASTLSVISSLRGLWTSVGMRTWPTTVEDALARIPVSQSATARAAFDPEPLAVSLMNLSRDDIARERSLRHTQVTVAGEIADAGFVWADDVLVPPPDVATAGWPLQPGVTDPLGDDPASRKELWGWLLGASAADLASETGGYPNLGSLLYLLLRDALLRTLSGGAQPPAPVPELVSRGRVDGQPDPDPPDPTDETYAATSRLQQVTGEALQQLVFEHLDLVGYRWDAWATSFATLRLAQSRAVDASAGVMLGGYGFVQGLERGEEGESAGYMPAPSVAHATTAAVLRSGQLIHADGATGDGTPMAVDLSSARARTAAWLLEGVHQGQRLGALLGYRLERSLHDSDSDRFIAPLRQLAPLDAPDQPLDGRDAAAAATDVVDGLALVTRQRGPGGIPWNTRVGSELLPPPTPAVQAALADLDDALDAVSDALVAESVHHLLQGRPARAAMALSAAADGELTVPELEFLATPRTGLAVTHRLVVATEGEAVEGWAASARAVLNPELEAWAQSLLPAPAVVIAAVVPVDPATGEPAAGASPVTATVSDLGLGALDLLWLADRPGELSHYLWWTLVAPNAGADGAPIGSVAIVSPPPGLQAGQVGLSDAIALGRAASSLLTSARPLDARDLTPPGTLEPGIDVDTLTERVGAFRTALDDAATAIGHALDGGGTVTDATALGVALREAWSCGIAGSIPTVATSAGEDTSGDEVLAQQAAAVLAEYARRTARANAAATGASVTAAVLQSQAQILAGDRLPIVAPFALPDDAPTMPELVAATTIDGAPPGQDVAGWIARIAHVRANVASLETLICCAELLGSSAALELTVGQLTPDDAPRPAPWVGLPGAPAGPHTSLAFAGAPPTGTTGLTGLFVDGWVETVPSDQEVGAIAFHYDAPVMQPAAAILLAVPPGAGAAEWALDDLTAVVQDVIDLAHTRQVAPTDLLDEPADLRQWLPAAYLRSHDTDAVNGIAASRLFVAPDDYALEVDAQAPVIHAVAMAPPVADGGVPAVQQGTTATVTVDGTALTGATFHASGDGLTVGPASGSDTHATLTLTAGSSASAGRRALQATTALGGSSQMQPFDVVPAPQLTAVAPASIAQTLSPVSTTITIQGLSLPANLANQATIATSDGRVGATLLPGNSATSVAVTITVAEADWPGSNSLGGFIIDDRDSHDTVTVVLTITLPGGARIDTSHSAPGLSVQFIHWTFVEKHQPGQPIRPIE